MTSKKQKTRSPVAARKRPRGGFQVGWLLAVGLLVAAASVALILSGFWSLEPAQTRNSSEASSKSRPSSGPATFTPTVANSATAPGPAPQGMVWIPGGEFSMGSHAESESLCALPGLTGDALPVHRVYIDGFWMDATELTNGDFARFVKATGYVTVAERTPTAAEFPTAPPENLVAGSTVFTPPAKPVALNNHYQWWSYVKGANWRHPFGPGSSIEGKGNYPVVQVAYADGEAYAKGAGKRLPTEAEFEFAARGGLSGKSFAWGSEFRPRGKWMANTYQGKFPLKDAGEDGYRGLAPVARFPANGYGLFDVAGNVWEWCSDWYRPDSYVSPP